MSALKSNHFADKTVFFLKKKILFIYFLEGKGEGERENHNVQKFH